MDLNDRILGRYEEPLTPQQERDMAFYYKRLERLHRPDAHYWYCMWLACWRVERSSHFFPIVRTFKLFLKVWMFEAI